MSHFYFRFLELHIGSAEPFDLSNFVGVIHCMEHQAAVARARRIVAAFEKAEADGLASIQLDGQFIDYPIVQRARRVLEQGGG